MRMKKRRLSYTDVVHCFDDNPYASLFLAVTDLRTHTTFLSSNFTAAFTSSFASHRKPSNMLYLLVRVNSCLNSFLQTTSVEKLILSVYSTIRNGYNDPKHRKTRHLPAF
jgi:hypothetical protein